MDAAQFAQFMNAAGGARGRRLDPFESGDAEEWLIWRRNFLIIANIQAWNNERCKQEIVASMKGRAANITRTIPYAGNAITTANLLDAYQARFVPEAASRLARATFSSSTQRPDETVLDFHSRLRSLFQRAYPARPNIEDDPQLIETFADGLADDNVTQYVHDSNPANYTQALQAAERKQASMHNLERKRQRVAAIRAPAVRGSKQAGLARANVLCYYCNKPGHIKRDCFAYQNDLARQSARPRGGRGRGRGVARRGHWRTSPAGPVRTRVAAIGDGQPGASDECEEAGQFAGEFLQGLAEEMQEGASAPGDDGSPGDGCVWPAEN